MIKHVIFDLDDTLYDESQFVYCGYKQVADYLGEKYNLCSCEIYEDMVEIFRSRSRQNLFDKVCAKYGINENIANLVSIYRGTEPILSLYEDARNLLEKLVGNYGLGIITDGDSQVQRNKICALGIEKYFTKIIVTDDCGIEYRKPSAEPYKEMIRHFGGRPDEFVYIGDNPHKDFVTAKKLGIYTVRIRREIGEHMKTILEKEYEADFTIFSLTEVERILKSLEEQK